MKSTNMEDVVAPSPREESLVSKKKQEFLEKRRNLNRVNARKSRLRKTFKFQALQEKLELTIQNAQGLREEVKLKLNKTASELVGRELESLDRHLTNEPIEINDMQTKLLEDSIHKQTIDKRTTQLLPNEKLERKRTLNRINARKSRLRKKAQLEAMTQKIDALVRENTVLTNELSKHNIVSESGAVNKSALASVDRKIQTALNKRLSAEDIRAVAEKDSTYELPAEFVKNNPIQTKTSIGSKTASSVSDRTINNKSEMSLSSSSVGKYSGRISSGDSDSKDNDSKGHAFSSIDSKSSNDGGSSSGSDSMPRKKRRKKSKKVVTRTAKALCFMRHEGESENNVPGSCQLCTESGDVIKVSITVCKTCQSKFTNGQ